MGNNESTWSGLSYLHCMLQHGWGKVAAQLHDAFMNGGMYVFNNSSCQTTKLNFVAIVLPLYYKQNLGSVSGGIEQ